VDEEREIPEEISFKQAKRELMNILYDTPESTDTEKSGIVAYSCIMDEETQGITGKGGFTGDTCSCMVAVVGIIEQLAETMGIDGQELAQKILELVSTKEGKDDMEFKVSAEIVSSDNTTEEQE